MFTATKKKYNKDKINAINKKLFQAIKKAMLACESLPQSKQIMQTQKQTLPTRKAMCWNIFIWLRAKAADYTVFKRKKKKHKRKYFN